MWDSHARKHAADLIEQLRTAQITNDQFMDNYPTSAKDPAVRPIFWQLWFLWDDQTGDPRAWPFICLEDYQREAAKAQP